MDINKAKYAYIENDLWLLSFGGAFQRASVYAGSPSDKARRDFREAIKTRVRDIVRSKYVESHVASAAHTKEIANLATWASEKYGHLLVNGRLRLGVTQKLFNLYLKYLWCCGSIPEPPHCPFDRTIIDKLNCPRAINWTDMDDLKEYKMLVRAAERAAGRRLSLAQWELREFSRQ